MGRQHTENTDTAALPWQPSDEAIFPGAQVKLLSRDEETDDRSLLVKLAPGFVSPALTGYSLDIFLLSGTLESVRGEVRAGQYLYIPGNESSGIIGSRQGAVFFCGLKPNQRREGEALLVDPDDQPWQFRVRTVPQSRLGESQGYVKFMRVDEPHQETVGLGSLLPGAELDCSEEHEPVDEILNLRGDMLFLNDRDEPCVIGPGIYQWRPPFIKHLPKYSHNGNVNFFITHGGTWQCPIVFKPHSDWKERVNEYRARFTDLF